MSEPFFQHCLPIQKFSYFWSVSDRLSYIALRQQVLQGVPNIDRRFVWRL